jgi:hypothetical protein
VTKNNRVSSGGTCRRAPRMGIVHLAARQLLGALLLAGPLALAGCGGGQAPASTGSSATASPVPTTPTGARAQLAARAAAAQDRHLVAFYRLTSTDQPVRTVSVTRAVDGTWRVDIPGGALGGTADVSVAATHDGLYQCAMPSAGHPDPVSCVRVAAANGHLKAANDPRVQHPFTDWLDVLTDRQAALAVSTAKSLAGAGGSCYSVESNSASLSAPLDLGIYCYAPDGTLTGAALGFGTLVLTGTPTAGPATVSLPGPVAAGAPLSMQTPSPSPSTSASNSASPSAAN